MDSWPQQQEVLVAAVDSALEDERWADVAVVLDDYFFALSMTAPETITRIWDRIPREWLLDNPRYLMAAAISVAVRKPFGMTTEHADRVFAKWVADQRPPAARDVMGVKSAEMFRHLGAGHFERAERVADEIQAVLHNSSDNRGFDDVLPIVLIRAGIARLLSGSVGRAISDFSEAWRRGVSSHPHPSAILAAAYCALAHALTTDYVHARVWRERGAAMLEELSGTVDFESEAVGNLADVLIAVGTADRDTAENAAQALDHGVAAGQLWWISAHARSRIALYWGDRDGAIRAIEAELQAYPPLTSPDSLAGIMLRADLADLHQAQQQLDAAERVLAAARSDQPHPAIVGTVARQLILRGDSAGAWECLSAASRSLTMFVRPPARWEILRANLAHQIAPEEENAAIETATQRIEHTGAYEAAFDAIPEVYRAVAALLELPIMPPASFAASLAVVLTPREKEILGLLATHSSVKDLAAALYISHNTAKSHLGRLYRKLGVTNRCQAVRAGYDLY